MAILLAQACLLAYASEGAGIVLLRAPSTAQCDNFVPNEGMESSNPVDVLCGQDWLLKLLSNLNQERVEEYLSESNGNLVRVMDFACSIPGSPGDTCNDCVTAFSSFYEMATTPQCAPMNVGGTKDNSLAQSMVYDAAMEVGKKCMTTDQPFQVFHPMPRIASDCYMCARAFFVQHACANTECNDAYGLSWWPFYPLPPNGDAPYGAGAAAADWGVSKVCDCFNRRWETPLSGSDLEDFGYCLWVVYQGDVPASFVSDA